MQVKSPELQQAQLTMWLLPNLVSLINLVPSLYTLEKTFDDFGLCILLRLITARKQGCVAHFL
jgi:hypothetical protein